MNEKNNGYLRGVLRRTRQGIFLMLTVILLSIAAALVFYLAAPDVNLDGGWDELMETAGAAEDNSLDYPADMDGQN